MCFSLVYPRLLPVGKFVRYLGDQAVAGLAMRVLGVEGALQDAGRRHPALDLPERGLQISLQHLPTPVLLLMRTPRSQNYVSLALGPDAVDS